MIFIFKKGKHNYVIANGFTCPLSLNKINVFGMISRIFKTNGQYFTNSARVCKLMIVYAHKQTANNLHTIDIIDCVDASP